MIRARTWCLEWENDGLRRRRRRWRMHDDALARRFGLLGLQKVERSQRLHRKRKKVAAAQSLSAQSTYVAQGHYYEGRTSFALRDLDDGDRAECTFD